MVALHYRWPNDVLLAGGKVGAVWVDAPAHGDPPAWLALCFAVNVRESPADGTRPSTSLLEQGSERAEATAVLELLARYLLSGLNRWADQGMASVVRAWRARQLDLAALGEDLVIDLGDERLCGRPLAVEDDGGLRLATASGERHVTPARFHGLQPADG